jgi:hypothetical protein
MRVSIALYGSRFNDNLSGLSEFAPYRCITLTQGQYAFVDGADFEWLNQWPWYARWNPEAQTFYASRYITGEDGTPQTLHMHNVIAQPRPGRLIDHWNGCGLDNRRVNLRPATNRFNAINRKKKSTNTSGYTGVKYSHKKYGKSRWFATVQVDGKRIYLGYFERKEDAVAARIAGELRYYGKALRIGAPTIPSVVNPAPRARSVRNTSGFEGVDFRKREGTKVWRSRVRIDNVVTLIGHFDSPEKASQARKEFLQNHLYVPQR